MITVNVRREEERKIERKNIGKTEVMTNIISTLTNVLRNK